MRKLILIGVIFGSTFAIWTIANRPAAHPSWTGAVGGFAYSPMRPGQSPGRDEYPGEAEIEADIRLIAQYTHRLRTYSLDGTLAAIPAIAARYGVEVTAGVWLDQDLSGNRRRIDTLIRTVAENTNITRVIVGNETLLNGTLSPEQLGGYLQLLRDALDIPVGTAETWNTWLEHREVADNVDFIAAHILPYWEGAPLELAVDRVHERMRDLAAAFPGLPIVIGEVGWPSNGRDFGEAAASRSNAEAFLREFLTAADRYGYEYFLMEAFDQPWKRIDEGEVGAYWGLFDGDREPKYALEGTFRPLPQSARLALAAALIATISFLLLSLDSATMRTGGIALLALAATAVANGLVFSLHDYFDQYWTFGSIVAAAVLLTGIAGVVLLLLIETHEWAEADFKERLRLPQVTRGRPRSVVAQCRAPAAHPAGAREFAVATDRTDPSSASPKVSIHVPAYEEPPAMLIETLNALANLDYPNYEVLVVDNNTRSEDLWRPVEAHCEALGERFRFFHVAPLAGYKAGALNYALERTAADAGIIAIVDADYRVDPDWLTCLLPHFDDPGIALVQAPQDYRDQRTRAFKRLCEAEYRGFFRIGMITRNERNAIIQHGTMTMIRKDALREVGGWAEWTVTEDAELGLRLLEQGYSSVYTAESHGQGLTPDRFRDYRSQRFRWAIGATQILRHHARSLLGLEPSQLCLGQRFHFLTGWATWLGDGLNLVFNLIAIGWSVLMLVSPLEFLPPVAIFSTFVLTLFVFKLVKTASLYRTQVRATAHETALAIWAGLALVFITGRAVLAGFANRDTRFVRTPKLARRDGIVGALATVPSEALLAGSLLTLGVAVVVEAPMLTLDLKLWSLLLIVFAVPHVAAVAAALLGCVRSVEEQQPELVHPGDGIGRRQHARLETARR